MKKRFSRSLGLFQELSNRCNRKLRRHYYNAAVNAKELIINKSLIPKLKVPVSDLIFGKTFTDHMLIVDWTENDGWGVPIIEPYGNISISPTSSSLHYGVEVFYVNYALFISVS